MKLFRRVAVVGSREFKIYSQLDGTLDEFLEEDDELVSGGAQGADSMAQRYAREEGRNIHIYYPKWKRFGRGAGFIRNKDIVENSDVVLAFYRKGHLGEGGTANTAKWARELGRPLFEFEETDED